MKNQELCFSYTGTVIACAHMCKNEKHYSLLTACDSSWGKNLCCIPWLHHWTSSYQQTGTRNHSTWCWPSIQGYLPIICFPLLHSLKWPSWLGVQTTSSTWRQRTLPIHHYCLTMFTQTHCHMSSKQMTKSQVKHVLDCCDKTIVMQTIKYSRTLIRQHLPSLFVYFKFATLIAVCHHTISCFLLYIKCLPSAYDIY